MWLTAKEDNNESYQFMNMHKYMLFEENNESYHYMNMHKYTHFTAHILTKGITV